MINVDLECKMINTKKMCNYNKQAHMLYALAFAKLNG